MVTIISTEANTDGTIDVVAECNGERVRAEGITYIDDGFDEGVFEEWLELARHGVEGFTEV